MMQKGQLLTK